MAESFFEEVYSVVSVIPPGRVMTYGQIAAYLGNPRAARTVGWALSSLPAGMEVPWHRVINSQGRISGAPEGFRAHEQRSLLEEEGVVFDETGRIDLAECAWDPAQ
jgi:methylated-DNA-protein-cysteine methyltransferase-like protein